jgi:diguanylate cyclase (GGDEF)-like protein
MVACSVSIGIACFPEDGRSLDALAARADRALYNAKKAGRNRVARYQPA